MTNYEKKLKKFLISVLRRATYKWQDRNEALKEARIERGTYICASCKELFGPKEIVIDHIIPVVSTKDGFIDWNEYVKRMFVEKDGFQILCNPCHDGKTAIEDNLRPTKEKKVKKINGKAKRNS